VEGRVMTVFEALCRAVRIHQAPVLLIDVMTELGIGAAWPSSKATYRALCELTAHDEVRVYRDAEGRHVYWPEPTLMAEPRPFGDIEEMDDVEPDPPADPLSEELFA